MDEPLVVIVGDDDVGQRADVVLGRRLPAVSRRIARALALEGRLAIDGKRSPPSTRVQRGQRLELFVRASASVAPIEPLCVTAKIVYVAKPAGMHTHRLRPDDPPALADAVALVHPECAHASTSPREGGALHRLDHDTTGVVAFARDRETWQIAREAFASREVVHKLYVAIARAPAGTAWPPDDAMGWRAVADSGWGIDPPPCAALRVSAPLGRTSQGDVVARDDGRIAITTIGRLCHASTGPHETGLFLLRLHTGARHQARVHMATLGWPLFGDARYGGATAPALMLHALRLDLSAAIAGEKPVIAPWPDTLVLAAKSHGVLPPAPIGLLTPGAA